MTDDCITFHKGGQYVSAKDALKLCIDATTANAKVTHLERRVQELRSAVDVAIEFIGPFADVQKDRNDNPIPNEAMSVLTFLSATVGRRETEQ